MHVHVRCGMCVSQHVLVSIEALPLDSCASHTRLILHSTVVVQVCGVVTKRTGFCVLSRF